MNAEITIEWDTELAVAQREICDRFGAPFTDCYPDLRIGLAPNLTAATRNLNGVRVDPCGDACGWYLWAGDEQAEPPEFYVPLRVQSVQTWAPLALPFLALPPGWRFLLRNGEVKVWKDLTLLETA